MDDGTAGSARRERAERSFETFAHHALRTPLADADDEAAFAEQMARIADGRDEQADLLADPDVPLSRALEFQVERTREGFEHRLERLAGDDADAVADAYLAGERDDWVGELAAYYHECLLGLEEITVADDRLFVLLVLRYPSSFTVNVSFAEGRPPAAGVRFESPTHADVDYDDRYGERYYTESRYDQREAAAYLRETGDVVREVFPDPDETPREERYGGFVYVTAQTHGSFTDVLRAVDPDPTRFDGPPDGPTIVPAGPEADRLDETLLADARVVA